MKNRRLLKKGERIRLKVRTFSGWKGVGIVADDESPHESGLIAFYKLVPGEHHPDRCFALRDQVALIRKPWLRKPEAA